MLIAGNRVGFGRLLRRSLAGLTAVAAAQHGFPQFEADWRASLRSQSGTQPALERREGLSRSKALPGISPGLAQKFSRRRSSRRNTAPRPSAVARVAALRSSSASLLRRNEPIRRTGGQPAFPRCPQPITVVRAHRLQSTLVGARAFPETCAIAVLGTDHLKTTAFELSNEQLEYLLAGSRYDIAVQDIGRLTRAGLRATAGVRILYRKRA